MGLIEVLEEKVFIIKAPILGICLGMQLLSETSEEGRINGLGWIKSEVVKFNFSDNMNLKIPHMGWVYPKIHKESKLFTDMFSEPKVLFCSFLLYEGS